MGANSQMSGHKIWGTSYSIPGMQNIVSKLPSVRTQNAGNFLQHPWNGKYWGAN